MVIDVYERYYKAECEFNGVKRRAAVVKLTSDSEAGNIRYTVSVSFFPHEDDEDFAVSYDAYSEVVIFDGKGRRSKKREAAFLEALTDRAFTILRTLPFFVAVRAAPAARRAVPRASALSAGAFFLFHKRENREPDYDCHRGDRDDRNGIIGDPCKHVSALLSWFYQIFTSWVSLVASLNFLKNSM